MTRKRPSQPTPLLHQQPDEQRRRAFNEGADARLSGRMAYPNPYPDNVELAALWRSGWWEVQEHYSKKVHGRWPVSPLRPVVGVLP